jgi:hypothetical protein
MTCPNAENRHSTLVLLVRAPPIGCPHSNVKFKGQNTLLLIGTLSYLWKNKRKNM